MSAELKKPEDTKKIKMVKAKTLHPIRLFRDPFTNKDEKDGYIVKENVEVELTEAEAQEFCDQGFQGVTPYAGERFGFGSEAAKIYRAKRI